MFGGLRIRLFFSYIMIIVLTLAVIGVALYLVLRSRPVLNETTSLRLFNLLNQVLSVQEDRGVTPPAEGITRLQRAAYNQLDRRLNTRVLVLDRNNVVLYDSRQGYREGAKANILFAGPYTVPASPEAPQVQTQQAPTIRGVLRNPDGVEWLFLKQAPSGNDPQQLLTVAIRAPRLLTIQETLQFYAQDLIGPALQAGLIGLAAAFLMSLVITRSVAHPLQEVARAAESFAVGNLDQTAPVRGPQEVKTVAVAFNQMAAQVNATREAQRDFLANVTHDLKTPLTSIQGFSQAIMDGVASNPAAAQRAAQIIHDEAGRLTRLVQELLDLAKIEAGRFSMTRHSIRLNDVLAGVYERLTPRAQGKEVHLVMNAAPLPNIAGDGDRLVQVYTNLVDNAIKHTPTGGTVTLHAHSENNGVLVQVRDTGEGIPASDLPHIFDRFFQVDKSRQRQKREGTGLGLTITKGIIDAHGGKIWVESIEGQGTTFSTWFPTPSHDASTILGRRTAPSGRFKAFTPTASKNEPQ